MSSVEFDEGNQTIQTRQFSSFSAVQNPHPFLARLGLTTPRRIQTASLIFVVVCFAISALLLFRLRTEQQGLDFNSRYGAIDQSTFNTQDQQQTE